VIVETRYRDWKGDWVDASPDSVKLVREFVDEHPANAAAYDVQNAAPPGAARCVVPDRQRVGIAAQVYSLWSQDSGGIGDLADVAALARSSDASVLLLSPLHAPLPGSPQEPSPYFPSSRQFRNPLHLRVDGVSLPNDPAYRIDRDAVWQAKSAVLEPEWERFGGDPAFDEFVAQHGDDLHRYATFCALVETRGRDWNRWPAAFRSGERDAVHAFAEGHFGLVGFHKWLQWRLDVQLREAADAGAGLIHDIAVGFNPCGADAWVWQDAIAPKMHVGAPPDEFNTAGQNWGLPPFIPDKLTQCGYRPIEAALRAAAEHGAGLRIDHVMGLFRLYWIPEGASAADGVYVRYPAAELLDVVARVSQDAGAFVVGEDLGTVEPGVRDVLAARGVMSYKVYWFEDDAPSTWPELALASVTTHDLPTIVSNGRDAGQVHGELLRAPCKAIVLTAEDVLGVEEQPNRPSEPDDPWNWSRRLPRSVDELAAAFRDQVGAPVT
jgi:4-alpha-glucanotransferase